MKVWRKKKMIVREAKSLLSFDELNVSAKTRAYLKRRFSTTGEAVRSGRVAAYVNNPTSSSSEKEFVSALDEAGFIRPREDFFMSFRVAALYCGLHLDCKDCFLTSINDLSNEMYESFIGISDEEVESVKEAMAECLTEQEYAVICRRFGLNGEDDSARGRGSVAEYLHVSICRVGQIEAKAIIKLRWKSVLPRLFKSSKNIDETVIELKRKLDELRRDPIFEKERELLKKLEAMKKLPFRFPDVVEEKFEAAGTDCVDISSLNLRVRTFNCMKHAGINTVTDVINFPKDRWLKIRNFSKLCLNDLIEKMHAAGYENFDVDIRF